LLTDVLIEKFVRKSRGKFLLDFFSVFTVILALCSVLILFYFLNEMLRQKLSLSMASIVQIFNGWADLSSSLCPYYAYRGGQTQRKAEVEGPEVKCDCKMVEIRVPGGNRTVGCSVLTLSHATTRISNILMFRENTKNYLVSREFCNFQRFSYILNVCLSN
jgi:hypothetical protein